MLWTALSLFYPQFFTARKIVRISPHDDHFVGFCKSFFGGLNIFGCREEQIKGMNISREYINRCRNASFPQFAYIGKRLFIEWFAFADKGIARRKAREGLCP